GVLRLVHRADIAAGILCQGARPDRADLHLRLVGVHLPRIDQPAGSDRLPADYRGNSAAGAVLRPRQRRRTSGRTLAGASKGRGRRSPDSWNRAKPVAISVVSIMTMASM